MALTRPHVSLNFVQSSLRRVLRYIRCNESVFHEFFDLVSYVRAWAAANLYGPYGCMILECRLKDSIKDG